GNGAYTKVGRIPQLLRHIESGSLDAEGSIAGRSSSLNVPTIGRYKSNFAFIDLQRRDHLIIYMWVGLKKLNRIGTEDNIDEFTQSCIFDRRREHLGFAIRENSNSLAGLLEACKTWPDVWEYRKVQIRIHDLQPHFFGHFKVQTASRVSKRI